MLLLAGLKTEGVYHLTGFTDAELTLAATFVADAIQNSSTFNTDGYMLLVSNSETNYYGNKDQDFIVRVTEPMTMILFGLGLIGLAGLRRKE
jgi:hypothetical protein